MFGIFAEKLATHYGVTSNELLRHLLWPISSRRGSLQGLLDTGSKGGPALELAKTISSLIEAKLGVDVELEALIFSEAVHISHALSATLFGSLNEPCSHHLLKSLIGYQLNFHKHFNPNFAGSWIENELRRDDENRILPAIPLFEFDREIPIQEILEINGLSSTKGKGRSLYARLAGLPHQERKQEIDNLVSMLRKQTHQESGKIIDLNLLDIVTTTASVPLDFVIPGLASLKKVSGTVCENLRRIRKFDSIITSLEDSYGKNQDLDFLSRISRVATFRRERV